MGDFHDCAAVQEFERANAHPEVRSLLAYSQIYSLITYKPEPKRKTRVVLAGLNFVVAQAVHLESSSSCTSRVIKKPNGKAWYCPSCGWEEPKR